MGINSTEVAYGFGQLGSVFNNTVSAITPPTNKVFVAITFLTDTTLNTSNGLLADNQTGTTLATARAGLEYAGTDTAAHNLTVGSETVFSGGGGKAVLTATIFPKGVTIYGRWTKITTITSGTYIAYIGD